MTLWQGLCHLPTSWHSAIGIFCGKFFLITAKNRKKIAQANIEACFPNLTKTEQQKIGRGQAEKETDAGIQTQTDRYR